MSAVVIVVLQPDLCSLPALPESSWPRYAAFLSNLKLKIVQAGSPLLLPHVIKRKSVPEDARDGGASSFGD